MLLCREVKGSGFLPAWFGEDLSDFAATVWGDALYIYGGKLDPDLDSLGSLFAYHLLEDRWEVLLSCSRQSSPSYPEGRHCPQMWALAGRLYILGGRKPSEYCNEMLEFLWVVFFPPRCSRPTRLLQTAIAPLRNNSQGPISPPKGLLPPCAQVTTHNLQTIP